jgi:hypothetical protein
MSSRAGQAAALNARSRRKSAVRGKCVSRIESASLMSCHTWPPYRLPLPTVLAKYHVYAQACPRRARQRGVRTRPVGMRAGSSGGRCSHWDGMAPLPARRRRRSWGGIRPVPHLCFQARPACVDAEPLSGPRTHEGPVIYHQPCNPRAAQLHSEARALE